MASNHALSGLKSVEHVCMLTRTYTSRCAAKKLYISCHYSAVQVFQHIQTRAAHKLICDPCKVQIANLHHPPIFFTWWAAPLCLLPPAPWARRPSARSPPAAPPSSAPPSQTPPGPLAAHRHYYWTNFQQTILYLNSERLMLIDFDSSCMQGRAWEKVSVLQSLPCRSTSARFHRPPGSCTHRCRRRDPAFIQPTKHRVKI